MSNLWGNTKHTALENIPKNKENVYNSWRLLNKLAELRMHMEKTLKSWFQRQKEHKKLVKSEKDPHGGGGESD